MEYDTMEAAAGAAVATGTSGQAAGSVDDTSAAASIHQHTAVIASAYKETDPIAKNNAVLCVLAPDDASTDIDSDRVAVRRIYNIEQDETGVLKYYPTTMKANDVGTEPPVTVDSILGKCSYESGELYTYVKFATGVPGILSLMVLPSIILVIMLIVTIVRASMGRDDEYTFEENYDEVTAKIPMMMAILLMMTKNWADALRCTVRPKRPRAVPLRRNVPPLRRTSNGSR